MYFSVAEVMDRADASEEATSREGAAGLTDFLDHTGVLSPPEALEVSRITDDRKVSAWSWARDPLKTLRSRRSPAPAMFPLSVYCQNV